MTDLYIAMLTYPCVLFLLFYSLLRALQSRNPDDWSFKTDPKQPFGAKAIVDVLATGLFLSRQGTSEIRSFIFDMPHATEGPTSLAVTAVCFLTLYIRHTQLL